MNNSKGPSSSMSAWFSFTCRKLLELEDKHPKIFFYLECFFIIFYIWTQVYYYKIGCHRGFKGKTLIKRGSNVFKTCLDLFVWLFMFVGFTYLLGYYLGTRRGAQSFRL